MMHNKKNMVNKNVIITLTPSGQNANMFLYICNVGYFSSSLI